MFGVTYTENEEIIASGVSYNVIESYITDSDYNNVVINNGKKYILVRVNISNKSRLNYSLNRDTFRLQTKSDFLLPVFSYQEKFSDLGETFTPDIVYSGNDKESLVVFEIKNSDESKDYIFKIKTENSNDRYKEIIVTPSNISSSKDMGSYNLPAKVTFNDSILKNSTLTIGNIEIAEKFKEEYEYTINGEVKKGTQFILPESSNRGESLIIKIKNTLELDKSSALSNYIDNPEDLFLRYGILKYRYQGKYVSIKFSKINTNYDKSNYSYLQVPKNIEEASKFEIILLIRGVKYTFILN